MQYMSTASLVFYTSFVTTLRDCLKDGIGVGVWYLNTRISPFVLLSCFCSVSISWTPDSKTSYEIWLLASLQHELGSSLIWRLFLPFICIINSCVHWFLGRTSIFGRDFIHPMAELIRVRPRRGFKPMFQLINEKRKLRLPAMPTLPF